MPDAILKLPPGDRFVACAAMTPSEHTDWFLGLTDDEREQVFADLGEHEAIARAIVGMLREHREARREVTS